MQTLLAKEQTAMFALLAGFVALSLSRATGAAAAEITRRARGRWSAPAGLRASRIGGGRPERRSGRPLFRPAAITGRIYLCPLLPRL